LSRRKDEGKKKTLGEKKRVEDNANEMIRGKQIVLRGTHPLVKPPPRKRERGSRINKPSIMYSRGRKGEEGFPGEFASLA
jgi:hypothetical protein